MTNNVMTTKSMKSATEAHMVRDAVLDHYLEHHREADVEDLAERLGWSVSKVRRVVNEWGGAVDGTQYTDRTVGSRARGAWLPTLSHMRELLLQAKT